MRPHLSRGATRTLVFAWAIVLALSIANYITNDQTDSSSLTTSFHNPADTSPLATSATAQASISPSSSPVKLSHTVRKTPVKSRRRQWVQSTALPLIVVTNELMQEARYIIGVHSRRNEHILVVGVALTEKNAHELHNILRVILIEQQDIEFRKQSYDNTVLRGIHLASRAFPERCMLLIDLRYVSTYWDMYKHYIVATKCRWNYPKVCRDNNGTQAFVYFPSKFDAVVELGQVLRETAKDVNGSMSVVLQALDAVSLSYQQSSLNDKVLSMEQFLGIQNDVTFPNNHPRCYTRHIRRTQTQWPFIDSRARLCIGVPTLGKNKSWAEHTLFRGLIQSMNQSMSRISRTVARRIYIAYEEGDRKVDVPGGPELLISSVHEHLTGMEIGVFPVRTPFIDQDNVYLWNSMFMAAFDDQCDYMFQLCDDIDLANTPAAGFGWEDDFRKRLKHNGDIGLIGHAKELNTQPFVHRSHFEAFGTFYHYEFHNWMGDTTLWLLYRALELLWGPNTLPHWVNLSDRVHETKKQYQGCEADFHEKPSWPGYSVTQFNEYLATRIPPITDSPSRSPTMPTSSPIWPSRSPSRSPSKHPTVFPTFNTTGTRLRL